MRRRAWMAGVVSATITSLGCAPKEDRSASQTFPPVRHVVRKPKTPTRIDRDVVSQDMQLDDLLEDLRSAQEIVVYANSMLVREIADRLIHRQPNAPSVRVRLLDRDLGSKARQQLRQIHADVQWPEVPVVAPRFLIVIDQRLVWIGEQRAIVNPNRPSLGLSIRAHVPESAPTLSDGIASLDSATRPVVAPSAEGITAYLGEASARRALLDAFESANQSIDLLVDDITQSDLTHLIERRAERHVSIRILARRVSLLQSELTRFETGKVPNVLLILNGDTCSTKGDLVVIDQSRVLLPVDNRIDSHVNLMIGVTESSMVQVVQKSVDRCLRQASYTTANQLERAWR